MKNNLKLILAIFFFLVSVTYRANAQFHIFQPQQGGTGIGSATAGDVGKVLTVLDDSPFTYTLSTVSSSGGGNSKWATSTLDARDIYNIGLSNVTVGTTTTFSDPLTMLKVVASSSDTVWLANFQDRNGNSKFEFNAGGDMNIRAGDLQLSAGSLVVDGGNITASTGNVNVTAGNINALSGSISGDTIYSQSHLQFDGEIEPDGATCSDGEILKKTGANNWDCAADDTGAAGSIDGTGTAGMMTSWLDTDTLTSTSAPTGAYFTATSSTATSTLAGGLTVNGTALSVDRSTSRVMIGTTTETAKLTIASTGSLDPVHIHSPSATPWAMRIFNDTFSPVTPVFDYYPQNTGGMDMGTNSNQPLRFYTNGFANVWLTMTQGQRLGVGELVPGSKLSVSGNGTIGTNYDTTAAPTDGLLVEGNVGISTTSPYAKLSVAGETVAQNFTATSTVATSTLPNAQITNILIGGDFINELAGTGLQVSSSQLQSTLGTSITVGELASADFGDWTCNGAACTVDADSVALTTDTTGNYVATVADGTGIDGTASGEGTTYTPTFDATELTNLTWSADGGASVVWTYAVTGTDPTVTYTTGTTTFSNAVKMGDFSGIASSSKFCFDAPTCRAYLTYAASGTIEMWINNTKVEEWATD